ncbi:MAG: acyl carrier protein [Bacteroidetes bacterium]|nr:acyl carrier protein [Bacteroidota bacterium]MCB0855652.1 acyl carrier protein [Bacteroidota bacterium]
MNKDQLITKLRTIIEPYVEDKSLLDDVNGETDLLNDLKINSAHLIDIILDVEEEFDIEINDEEADQMITVEAVLEIISGKMKA